MRRFINKIKGICEKNKRVAMFVDMDGTINEYEVYSEKTLSQQMEDRYKDTAPVQPIIDVLKEINERKPVSPTDGKSSCWQANNPTKPKQIVYNQIRFIFVCLYFIFIKN